MKSVTYAVPNISCNHCTHTIAMELSDIPGVSKVDTDVHSRLVTVAFQEPATERVLKDALIAINYPPDE